MPEILVVCTANICRSPVVETILDARLAERGLDGWRVSSAGTRALPGFGAAEHSVAVVAELGLDLREHRSRRAEERHVAAADLVLCMEWGHKEALQVEYPEHRGRIYLLTEMVGEDREVADPIGGPRAGYRRMADEVRGLIEAGLPRIVELVRGNARRRGTGGGEPAASTPPGKPGEP